MRFVFLFLSFILSLFFLRADSTQATSCDQLCNDVTPNDLWADCILKCQNEGGELDASVYSENQDISTEPSPLDKGSVTSKPSLNLKNAGQKLFNTANPAFGSKANLTFEEIVGGYIKGALALVGVIFLLLMVYGGYTWMVARGDEQEATKAKHTVTMATLGMSVVLIAYVIAYFIVARLTQAGGIGS